MSMSNFTIPNISIAGIRNQIDEVRAQVYPRNETEKKVYEALSSKNWGASTTLMNDIANESMDYEKYNIIVNLIWASMETEGKSWKQVYKALTLLDFLIKNGSERIIEAARDKLYKIRVLQEFNFYEGTQDKGSGVREMAKKVIELLSSNETIRSEREKARSLRNKFVGISNDGRSRGMGGGSDNYYSGGGGGGSSSYSSGGGGGGYDRDSRDTYSGGGGGGGGRYDGEPYNSGPSKNSSKGYGGGAYDSSRPPRFGDDVPDEPKEKSRPKAVEEDDEEEDDFRASKGKVSSNATSKFKVNIKKAASTTPVKTAAKEIDFFGGADDIMSAPAAPAQSAPVSVFDPFAAPSVPTSTADPFSSQPFAAFSSPATAFPTQSAPAFDPFAAPAMPVQQPHQQAFSGMPSSGFGAVMGSPMMPAQQQQQQQQFGQAPQQNGWDFPPAAQPFQMQQQQQPSFAQQQQDQQQDFGEFEGARSSQAAPAPAPNKWGDIDKLVNLGGITKNEDQAKAKAAAAANMQYSQNSFAGLDGFSKPQNMMSSAPMGSMGMGSMGMGGMGMGGMGMGGMGGMQQMPAMPVRQAQPMGMMQQQMPGMYQQPMMQQQQQQPMGYPQQQMPGMGMSMQGMGMPGAMSGAMPQMGGYPMQQPMQQQPMQGMGGMGGYPQQQQQFNQFGRPPF